jgi:hypothetical protein
MEPSTITIILALVGILKGKDLWNYLKNRTDSKHKGQEKVIEIYEVQIQELKNEIKRLNEKLEQSAKRLEKKIFKSRGRKDNESNS